MNPNTNTSIGNPIINSMATNTPAVPISAPVGIVAPVTLVKLAVIVDVAGIELSNENTGEITAAITNPIIKAHIDPIAASIKANEMMGIFSTSLPFISSLIPPNRGANRL